MIQPWYITYVKIGIYKYIHYNYIIVNQIYIIFYYTNRL